MLAGVLPARNHLCLSSQNRVQLNTLVSSETTLGHRKGGSSSEEPWKERVPRCCSKKKRILAQNLNWLISHYCQSHRPLSNTGALGGPNTFPCWVYLGCGFSASCFLYPICFLSLGPTTPASQTLVSLQSPALSPFPSSFPSSPWEVQFTHITPTRAGIQEHAPSPRVVSPLQYMCFQLPTKHCVCNRRYQRWSKRLFPFKKQVV